MSNDRVQRNNDFEQWREEQRLARLHDATVYSTNGGSVSDTSESDCGADQPIPMAIPLADAAPEVREHFNVFVDHDQDPRSDDAADDARSDHSMTHSMAAYLDDYYSNVIP